MTYARSADAAACDTRYHTVISVTKSRGVAKALASIDWLLRTEDLTDHIGRHIVLCEHAG